MGDESSYIEKMRKNIVFKFLSDSELNEMLSLSDIIHQKADDRIISEGDVSPYLYAVLDGCVNVLVTEKNGKEVFINAIGESDIFGEAGIFLAVKRTANISCAQSTTLLRVHRKALLEFIQNHSGTGVKMLLIIIYSLLRKLRDSNQELAFERKDSVDQDDIDSIVEGFLAKE